MILSVVLTSLIPAQYKPGKERGDVTQRVKGQMEEKLKTLNFPGLAIFRPSLLLGPRTEKRAGEKFSGYMMKALDFMIPSKYKAIHVDKVAKKMIEVALKDEKGVHILESDKLQ